MTIKTSILIEANGKQAKTEIEAVERAVKKTGTATEELGRKARTGATGTKELGGAAGQAEAKVESLAAAERRAAAAASEMDRSNRRASAATANLVSQGNDIFVMLAAGQDPMQLALQQGTQINQVFAQLGGGMGALRGVGSAIMAMVSPMSLLTIGTIAGGAALTQWIAGAMGAGEEAVTFEDRLDKVASAVDAYRTITNDAASSTKDLSDRFGKASEQGQGLLSFLENIAKSEAQRQIDGISGSLANLMGIAGDGDKRTDVAKFFNADLFLAFNREQRAARDETRALTAEFVAQQDVLASSSGNLEGQIDALERMKFAAEQLADLDGSRNGAEDELLQQMGETLVLMYEQLALTKETSSAYADYYASRIAGEEYLANMRAEELTAQAEIYSLYSLSRTESDAALDGATEMLTALQGQADLKDLIAAYGSDSLQVAQFHVDAEREVQQALVDSLDVADSMKVELMAAWDAAKGISGADMAAGIGAAADEAYRLTGNIIAAVNAQNRADFKGGTYSGRGDGSAERNLLGGGLASEGDGFSSPSEYFNSATAEQNRARLALNRGERSSGRKKGGGGKSDAEKARDDAAKAAEREQKAVDSLIGSLREEVDVQRLLDPVQQEMRRHRDTLASATSAERAEVEKLITTREAEATAMAAAKEQMDFFKSSGFELFDDLTDGAGGFGDSLESIADRIRQIALEALLLGEGPLAGLLGGGNAAGGGLLGMAAKAFIPGLGTASTGSSLPPNVLGDGSLYADGGLIHGPGGGRSDDIPIWASSGEFMMNAKATAKNRQLLEVLNAGGSLPGFANGGAIGGGSGSMAPQINIMPMNDTGRPLQMDVEEDTGPRGERQQKLVISEVVASGLQGAPARRAMGAFGAKQQGIGRG
jgi:hypothetical protein